MKYERYIGLQHSDNMDCYKLVQLYFKDKDIVIPDINATGFSEEIEKHNAYLEIESAYDKIAISDIKHEDIVAIGMYGGGIVSHAGIYLEVNYQKKILHLPIGARSELAKFELYRPFILGVYRVKGAKL